jgi:hypothetical protein
METLNIAKLIERNEITRLSSNYQSKFINKIKENFTDNHQQLFVSSFYTYLNYDSKKDFVIEFDSTWKWLGFSRKDPAKRLLEKHFVINIDYKVRNNFPHIGGKVENEQLIKLAPPNGGASFVDTNKAAPPNYGAAFEDTNKLAPHLEGAKSTSASKVENLHGGQNKEIIVLSINTFKKFCLKAGTKKADDVHDYYIRLEELLNETINEETSELRLQLENTTKSLEDTTKSLEDTTKTVQILTKKYIKPQKQIFEGKNAVYLMTSEEGEKARTYTVGKATDLSNRKEDYNHNKIHDFKVVYYISCKNTKFMDVIEGLVLSKLSKYKCKANRDVFELPDTNDVSLFINIVDECVKFYDDVEEVIYPKRTGEKLTKEENKEKNDKYQLEHKDEIKEKQEIFYEENKEPLAIIGSIYYEKNADIIAEKHKKYYEENKEEIINQVMGYYNDNKEKILEERKDFYEANKEQILQERSKYYKDNYKTKIFEQRSKKETCECGMTVTHYSMKRHKNSQRHKDLMGKIHL